MSLFHFVLILTLHSGLGNESCKSHSSNLFLKKWGTYVILERSRPAPSYSKIEICWFLSLKSISLREGDFRPILCPLLNLIYSKCSLLEAIFYPYWTPACILWSTQEFTMVENATEQAVIIVMHYLILFGSAIHCMSNSASLEFNTQSLCAAGSMYPQSFHNHMLWHS